MILEQKEYELILENSPNMIWRAGKVNKFEIEATLNEFAKQGWEVVV